MRRATYRGDNAGSGIGGRNRGGAQLASANWDGTVKLWDVYGGGGALESLPHAAEMLALACASRAAAGS